MNSIQLTAKASVTVVPMPRHSGCFLASLTRRSSAWSRAALQLPQSDLRLAHLEVGEPLEGVEQEFLNRFDGHGTGDLPSLVSAHAVGDQEGVPPVAAESRRRLAEIGLVDVHGPGQLRNDEVILVGRSGLPTVAQAETPHDEGGAGVRSRRRLRRGGCGRRFGTRSFRLPTEQVEQAHQPPPGGSPVKMQMPEVSPVPATTTPPSGPGSTPAVTPRPAVPPTRRPSRTSASQAGEPARRQGRVRRCTSPPGSEKKASTSLARSGCRRSSSCRPGLGRRRRPPGSSGGNSAADGGGIFGAFATVTVDQSTLSGKLGDRRRRWHRGLGRFPDRDREHDLR